MISAARCGWLLLLVSMVAWGEDVRVVNGGFEQGDQKPVGWTLTGNGRWLDRHAIVAEGNGKGSSFWRSEALTLEPKSHYVVSFKSRKISGSGGTATSGPMFANRDLHKLTWNWQSFESVFITPDALTPEMSRLRFGQWEVNGAVAFDDVALFKATVAHRVIGDPWPIMSLGEGERIAGRAPADGESIIPTAYEFVAPLNGAGGNYSRPLKGHTASFNSNRWVFSDGALVTYYHKLDKSLQSSISVDVAVNYHIAGRLIVEWSILGHIWEPLGTIDSAASATFSIPKQRLPVDEMAIRLRAEKDDSGKQANFQVDRYAYRAALRDSGHAEGVGATKSVTGITHFIKVLKGDPRLDVYLYPANNDCIDAYIRTDQGEVSIKPVITVFAGDGGPVKTAQKQETAPHSCPFVWRYRPPASGPYRVQVALGGDSPYRAEVALNTTPLDDASYGQLISRDKGVWWCSSGHKVGRSRAAPWERGEAVRISAAANETEAAQLVIRDPAMIGLSATCTELTGAAGGRIPAGNVEILQVGYVSVTHPTDRSTVAGEWPDPLVPLGPGEKWRAGENHPLWVRVHVPRNTPPGDYEGTIALKAEGFDAKVPLRVHVYDFELPDRLTCSTAFGFSPSNVFKYQRLEKIEDRRAVLEKYWANFAAHHVSPYDPAPLDPFKITWPAKNAADLNPTIDWTRWDAAMTRAFDKYHFNSFMLRVQGLGGGTFHERVEPSFLGFSADSPQYRALMKNYLGQLQAHLKENGWLDRAFVYWFDEPDPKDYDFVNRGFARLKEDAPLLRRMLTEQVEEKLVGGPTIWCPVTPEFNAAKAGPRMAAGEEFWWYVCTAPKAPYATLFIDHPATEMRVWLWQTWQRGIKGILVWETNYWTSPTAYPDSLQDPYDDPMSWQTGYGVPKGSKRPWGNGDGRFIYPPVATRDRDKKGPILDGPVDSIRWEMLRDGLEDYEYLAILQRLLKDRPDAEAAKLLEVPESITRDMTTFTKDPAAIEARRDQIARAIEKLSRK